MRLKIKCFAHKHVILLLSWVLYKALKQESFTITVGVNEQQCYGLQWFTNSTTNNATTFNKNLLFNYEGVHFKNCTSYSVSNIITYSMLKHT